jgi:hypothetical protein
MKRQYLLEQIDDAAVVQFYADEFHALPLDQKILAWHLYQAALAGRDIYYDQRYRHAIEMRDVLEEIITHAAGIDPATLAEIRRYTKLFWINYAAGPAGAAGPRVLRPGGGRGGHVQDARARRRRPAVEREQSL